MEENNKKGKSEEKIDKGSNSCVMDLSIDGGNGAEETEKFEKNDNNDNTKSLNKSFDDLLNFSKKLNLKDNFENILDITDEDIIDEQSDNIRKTRSKTFKIEKSTNKMAPKPKPIEIDEYIKPLRLNSNKSNIRENSQKDLIECKSLDDLSEKEKNYVNYFSSEDSEEEYKNTLKINKIKNENKKMLFDYKINCKYYNEYENILNIEKVFWKNIKNSIYDDILIGKNKNIESKNKNKRKFWHKYINDYKKQLSSVVSVKKSETKNDKVEFRKRRSDTFSKRNNYEGLFILGVLESAAKDKKRRRTMHIKKEINKNLKDEDEDKK